MSKDMIKRPEHYCFSKFEPKDVIREWGLNFNLGSAVKYIARAGRKDDIVQDLKKAREFLSFEIEALEADRGLVSKASNDYCMKHFGVNDVLDGYTLDFHMIVPRGMSIDEVVDMWSESWEEKANESCTSWV
jgi:hypothetical protein